MSTSEIIVLPTCAICRDEDSTDLNLGITRCGHLFHSACIEEWDQHQSRLGRRTTCPDCNTGLSYSTPITIRLHQLTKQHVIIIPDGQPNPIEQLKTTNKKLEKLQADRLKLTRENRNLKAKIKKLNQETSLKENLNRHVPNIETERQLRNKHLDALYQGEQRRLRRQLEDSKEAYENILAGLEPIGLTTNTPAHGTTPWQEQRVESGTSHRSSNISIQRKRSRPSATQNEKGKAPTVIEIESDPDFSPSAFKPLDNLSGSSSTNLSRVLRSNSSTKNRTDPVLASLKGTYHTRSANRPSGSGSKLP